MQATLEVVSTPLVVNAPSAVRMLLVERAIPYREVIDLSGLSHASKVQAVLLDDASGILLVLFGQGHLLDLTRLASVTGRHMSAVSRDRLEAVLGKHDLKQLPGVPVLIGSPCLYEEHLLLQPCS